MEEGKEKFPFYYTDDVEIWKGVLPRNTKKPFQVDIYNNNQQKEMTDEEFVELVANTSKRKGAN